MTNCQAVQAATDRPVEKSVFKKDLRFRLYFNTLRRNKYLYNGNLLWSAIELVKVSSKIPLYRSTKEAPWPWNHWATGKKRVGSVLSSSNALDSHILCSRYMGSYSSGHLRHGKMELYRQNKWHFDQTFNLKDQEVYNHKKATWNAPKYLAFYVR